VGRPAWSADGNSVYFFWQQKSGREIWRAPAASDGSAAPVQVTHGGGFEGFESADGHQFYYVKDTRSHELWRLPLPAGEAQIVIVKGICAGWWQLRADGIAFADIANPGDTTTLKPVWFYSFRTGEQRKIGELAGNLNPDTPDFQVSPDLKHILFARFDAANSDIETISWP